MEWEYLCDPEERDQQSSFGLNGSRLDNRRVRKRPMPQWKFPSEYAYNGSLTTIEEDSSERKSMRTAQLNLLDISTLEDEQNSYSRWKSIPSLTEERDEHSTRRSTIVDEITEDDICASPIGDDEIETRDRYSMFHEDEFQTDNVTNKHYVGTIGTHYVCNYPDDELGNDHNDNPFDEPSWDYNVVVTGVPEVGTRYTSNYPDDEFGHDHNDNPYDEPSWDYDVVISGVDEYRSCDGREQTICSRTSTVQSWEESNRTLHQQGTDISCSNATKDMAPDIFVNTNAISAELTEKEDTIERINARGETTPMTHTLKHEISRLNQSSSSRRTENTSTERKACSFDAFLVMFSFRLMSRNQFLLDCDHEGPLVPYRHIEMNFPIALIHHITRWLFNNGIIQKQNAIHSYNESNHASSALHSHSNYPDPCDCCSKSSIRQKEECLDMSNYVPPDYVQHFLKVLDETVDLTPAYIHAHIRTELQSIETDDDGMSEESDNLHFVEAEIKKELNKVDAHKAAELSEDIFRKHIPTGFENMNSAMATDVFYNAVAALSTGGNDSSDGDTTSSEDTETTFDVENARETVLKLVNQIQSNMPRKNADEKTEDLPQVQKKIMKDLFLLSQRPPPLNKHPEPLSCYEVSIDVNSPVSSIGCDLDIDDIKDKSAFVTLERSDSVGSCTGVKMDPILEHPSEVVAVASFTNSDLAIQMNRDEYYEESRTPHAANHVMFSANDARDIPDKIRKTVLATLLDRRQKSTQKSDRRSPFPPKVMVSNAVPSYLQFKRERIPTEGENCSISTENSLDVESKYLSQEYIRESHENNNSIEVILKDEFQISSTEEILAPVTDCKSESKTVSPKQSSNDNFTKGVIETTEASQDTKLSDFWEKENTPYFNRIENVEMGTHYMHDETSIDYLGEISLSMSPVIDPFSSTSDKAQRLTKSENTEEEIVGNRGVNTELINSGTSRDSMPIVSMTNQKFLPHIRTSDSGQEDNNMRILTESPQKGKANDNTNSEPSELSGYWNSLLTYSFPPSFEESIENEPTYVM